MNFELVSELAGLEGIQTRQIYIADDITSASAEEKKRTPGDRRSRCAYKISGSGYRSRTFSG